MDSYSWIHQCWGTSKNLYLSALWCLVEMIVEKEARETVLSEHLDNNNDNIYIYIYIYTHTHAQSVMSNLSELCKDENNTDTSLY